MSRVPLFLSLLLLLLLCHASSGPNADGYQVKLVSSAPEPLAVTLETVTRPLGAKRNRWSTSDDSVSPFEHVSLIPTNPSEMIDATIALLPALLFYYHLFNSA